MDSFREDIKDILIAEIGINPIAYDEKKGFDRSKSNGKNYIYDKADDIITQEVHKYFGKKEKQLHRTFFSLYHCNTPQQARAYLSLNARKNARKNKEGIISMSTVRKYIKRSKKKMINAIDEDAALKEKIQRAIRDEYEK